MPKLVWLNGEIQPLEIAVTSVADHAHLYGDGLFEGIRIYGRKVFKLDEHLDRLYHGIDYLGFEMHISQKELRATNSRRLPSVRYRRGIHPVKCHAGTGLGLDPKNISRVPNVMIMARRWRCIRPTPTRWGCRWSRPLCG